MIGQNNYKQIKEQDAIFSALIDPAIIYDIHSNVIQVNSSFLEKYNCNPVGLNVKEIKSMFSCRWLDESRYLCNEQPTARALKGEKTSGSIFSLYHNGKEYFVETSSAPIIEYGKITGALTVWHTIDNYENLRIALSKKEELHRRIDDYSPVGVIINKNGFVEYANNAALKILGAKHLLDVEGKTAFDFFDPKFEKLLSRRIESLHAGKIVDEAEQKIIRIDGQERDVEIKAINVSDSENKIIKVYFRDISSQKKINFYNTILSSIYNRQIKLY